MRRTPLGGRRRHQRNGAVLIYVTLFMNNHFSHRTLPASQLTSLYLGENLALAVTATVRLLAMPDGEDRYFHRTACTFAWLMILVSTPLNYLDAYVGPTNGKAIEVGWMIPFLAVAVLAFSNSVSMARLPSAPRSTE